MATKQKLDWQQSAMLRPPDEQPGWRSLIVADGVLAHEAALPEGMTVQDGLADYAAGYDAGDTGPCEIEVEWALWVGGQLEDRGHNTFSWPACRD